MSRSTKLTGSTVLPSNMSLVSPKVILANSLTIEIIERLGSERHTYSEAALCSLDVQYCSSEISAVIEALGSFRLLSGTTWIPDGIDLSSTGQSEPQRSPPIVSLAGLDLRNINLSNFNTRGIDLSNSNLRGAILRDIGLIGANLVGANLSMTNLSESTLLLADLRLADLSGANLQKASVSANLEGANLAETNLSGAHMSANLKFADLAGANLRRANLEGASLRGASLRGTDLSMANLERTDLEGAIHFDEEVGCPEDGGLSCSTQFPEGFDPEQAGLILWTPEN